MIHNMTGGGKPKHFAAISVTYPAGAILTCSNGSKVLTAGDTSGHWMFTVPSAGDWTVKAVAGSQVAEQTISISEEKEHGLSSLFYSIVLFENGEYADVTGGFDTINGDGTLYAYAGTSSTAGVRVGRYSKALIDLSGYSKLHFQVVFSKQTHNGMRRLGISAEASADANKLVAYTDDVSVGEQVLDISDITGSYAILVFASATPYTSNNQYAETALSVSKIWAD